MSRKFKKHDQSFNREILQEFMSDKELQLLDEKYNAAKIKRMIRKVESSIATKVAKKAVEEILNQ